MNNQREISDPNFYKYNAETLPGAVETFLKSGGDANGTYNCDKFSFWKLSPLYFAVSVGSAFAVRQLLGAGADPSATGMVGVTPLHITCRSIDQSALEIAVMLLDHGADLLAKDRVGCSPLHYAFHARKSPLVELLLARLPKGANPTDSRNLSAFHVACAHGADQTVRDLLDSGVQIDHYTEDTWLRVRLNGLQFAIMDNRKSTVELLLQQGAAVNAPGETLLHLACECNMEKFSAPIDGETFKLCNNREESQQSHLGIVNLLLDHGIDVGTTNNDGLTPLLHSCTYRVTSTTAWRTPLKLPDSHTTKRMNERIMTRRRLIAQCLLERGAAIDTRSPDGRSILHLTFECNFSRNVVICDELMKLFVEYGADVNARDERNFTPLRAIFNQALYFDNPVYEFITMLNVKLLLKHGADVNARVDGLTPVTLLTQMYDGESARISRCISLKILLVHAQRLLSLGLPLDREIRKYLEERRELGELDSVEEECANELSLMRSVRVDDTSLYRLLRTGLDSSGQFLAEPKLREVMEDLKISENYPHYASLFELRIRRGQLEKKAEPTVKLIARCELPYLCTEVIFEYLSNVDLRNLAEITCNKRKRTDTVTIESKRKKVNL